MRRFFEPRLLFRSAVTVALLAILVWRVDIGAAASELGAANYLYLLPAVVTFGATKLVVARRWQLMMSTFARLPLSPLFGILSVSNLANNVLPARLGDLVRVQVPAQRFGVSRARLAATVFATESLLDGIALAGLGLIGLALIDVPGFPAELFWAVLGLLTGALLAVVPLSHLKLEGGWTERSAMRHLPDGARRFVEESLPHFLDGLGVFRHLQLGVRAIALSFTLWLIEVGTFALLGLAFGITLSMPAWMLVMIAANLVSAVPVTPSNIGAYEVAITELLKALGVEPAAAAGFAIAAHAFNIIWISAVGFASMWALRLTMNDVFSLRSRPQAEPSTAIRVT